MLLSEPLLAMAYVADTAPEGGARYAPDGRRIAFYSERGGNGDLYVMNADGSGQRPHTESSGQDSGPVWSPDGSTIAFLSGRSGAFDVWKAPLAGGAATQLTERTNPLDEPRWTPRWSRSPITAWCQACRPPA